MTIIVTRRIKKRELRDFEAAETKAIFTKLKQTQATAVLLSAPRLPPGSTLHKVYATSSGGARLSCTSPGPVRGWPLRRPHGGLPEGRW